MAAKSRSPWRLTDTRRQRLLLPEDVSIALDEAGAAQRINIVLRAMRIAEEGTHRGGGPPNASSLWDGGVPG
jgi:hypothetical protein